MALSIPSRVVDASIYKKVGNGMCQPAQGEAYGYMLTRSRITAVSCSEACDSANAHHPEAIHHYRGFTHVTRGNSDLGLVRGDCFCHYDCHHLPSLADDLMDAWSRHDPEDIHGEGRVAATDGTPLVACYEVMVEDTVTPQSDKGVVWAGYHDVHGP